MHAIYIRATHGQIWSALTESSQTRRYFDFMVGFLAVASDWQIDSPVQYRTGDGQAQIEGRILKLQAPRNLVTTFSALYDEQAKADPPSQLSWDIEQLGEVCKLTAQLDDSGRASPTERDFALCMPSILSNLKIVLETGQPRRIKEIVFDCASPARLGTFWVEVIGYTLQGPPPAAEDDFVRMADPLGIGPELGFQRVPEPNIVKNRVHLDLHVGDLAAEIIRLVELGAMVQTQWPDGSGVVMTDPEGNEFCVFST